MISDVAHALPDQSPIDTPPTSTGAWAKTHGKAKPWAMHHLVINHADSEDKTSPIDSVVGSPRGQHEIWRTDQEHMNDQLLRGVWSLAEPGHQMDSLSHSMPLLLRSVDDDHNDEIANEAAEQRDGSAMIAESEGDEGHVQDSDEIMAGVLGHMSDVTDFDLDEISSEVSDLGWPAQIEDLTPIDGVLEQAEMLALQHPEAKEVDEVEWLRRTYETVYNPAARQRALDQLLSSCASSKRQVANSKAAVARATKSTVVYDYV